MELLNVFNAVEISWAWVIGRPITKYVAPFSIAFFALIVLAWSSSTLVFLIPGVIFIKLGSKIVLEIPSSSGEQTIPSIFDLTAISNKLLIWSSRLLSKRGQKSSQSTICWQCFRRSYSFYISSWSRHRIQT